MFIANSKSLVRAVSVGAFLCMLTASARGGAKSEAYIGQPFGVGRVTVDVLRGEPVLPLSDERFTVLEAGGRAMYPVLKQEPIRGLIRGLLDLDAPRKVTIYYLFNGDQPFDLSAFSPYEQGVRVRPLRDPRGHQLLLAEWWQQYTKRYQQLASGGEYPPIAENFLIATLSRRLGLKVPESRGGLLSAGKNETNPFDYLLVNEAYRLRVDRELLAAQADGALQAAGVPEPIAWADAERIEDGPQDIAIEPLAKHVPEECFYVRFGSFLNYLWFRDLNKKWQGDLGNMILRRGIVRGASKRIQQQISLRDNALAKIFGPKVIGDAGMIGLDPYMDQGAAIGLIFQAKNEVLLSADLLNQRRASLQKFDDATEETLEIEGETVSLISNPAGEVRSYHVKHDGVHLVTTSRRLVERFLQAGQGKGSLADLASFRRARQSFPLDRDDTLFAFVSERFWQNLCSPQYVIENYRRMRSVRESAVLELASYAARCETPGAGDEIDLSSVLPTNFAARSDGSSLQVIGGDRVDSLRGKPGFFVAIADMTVEDVTAGEVAVYERVAQAIKSSVGQMPPPVAAAVKRTPSEIEGIESISVDVVAQGAIRDQLGQVGTWIGQPSETRLAPVEGDLVAGEAVLIFPGLLGGGEGTGTHLFGALRDFRSPLVVKRGAVRPDAPPAELVRGYLGSWPKPGLLNLFSGGGLPEGAQPEAVGEDMWQAKQDEFFLLSFKPEVVTQVLPQLARVPAERPGQVRLRVEDLTGTELAESVNAFGYMRTRDTSVAGSRMMNSLANQLQVPRHQCKDFAERLIDGRFVCPLGGEYQLYEPTRGLEVWASSSLPVSNKFLLTEVPDDFRLPMLQWFRGLDGDMCLNDESLSVHLEIEMTEAALP